MDQADFYRQFTSYIKSKDNQNANMILMKELGRIMASNREDFIYVLKFSGIPIPDQTYVSVSDIDLVNLFINNVDKNRKLILGAAYLISHNNKMVGFDGQEFTSNICADAINKSMTSYFCGCSKKSSFEGAEVMSYFEGDPEFLGMSHADGDALKAGLTLGGDLIGAFSKSQDNKASQSNNSAVAALKSKQDAKAAMVQGIIDTKKQQLINTGKETEAKAAAEKSKRTKMIVAGVSVGVVVLAVATVLIVKAIKNRKSKS